MAAHSGGSLGDLSTLDDLPFVESLGFEDLTGGVAVVGLHIRKQLGTSQYLEHLKKEKLKTVRDSCRWASKPAPPVLGTKLPPIPASGKHREKQDFFVKMARLTDCLTTLVQKSSTKNFALYQLLRKIPNSKTHVLCRPGSCLPVCQSFSYNLDWIY